VRAYTRRSPARRTRWLHEVGIAITAEALEAVAAYGRPGPAHNMAGEGEADAISVTPPIASPVRPDDGQPIMIVCRQGVLL
jgi:hypothetical protein